MKRGIILILSLIIFLCASFSGCTTAPGTGTAATTAMTTRPPVEITTVKMVVTPSTTVPTIEPIRTLPPEQQVSLVLTKDRPTSEIYLQYQGGPGAIFVNRVMMRVYASETVYTEYIMSNGKQPVLNDEIVAPGTRGGDRCEVFVISSGTRYKVMDEVLYAGMYY